MDAQADVAMKFKKIGIVGAGNMGSMMGFAFSELGRDVSIWDVKSANIYGFMKQVSQCKGFKGKITGFYDMSEFAANLGERDDPKVFIISITHGDPTDQALSKLRPELNEGDIIMDGGNEHYRNTKRRQKECRDIGVDWIGMGISGGYQSARHGPSLSPGGDNTALEEVMPLLELYAAKDPKSGVPCVSSIGPGGSGHFVKMVHNGIEVGMLSALCEAWSFLNTGMGLDYHQIGQAFQQWNNEGELHGTFLVKIAADACKARKHDGGYVLDDVLDKVVQDGDASEGTPIMVNRRIRLEAHIVPDTRRRTFFPHCFGESPRTAQGRPERRHAPAKVLSRHDGQGQDGPRPSQGRWNIRLSGCIRIWRAGCIIQSEFIADMLEPFLNMNKTPTNAKLDSRVGRELQRNYGVLKDIVSRGLAYDDYIPALSATLEYMKCSGGTMLPTRFVEAQMDYFGAHSYDKPGVPGEDPGPVAKGAHDYEWKPA
ncbi:6-phosphogluconate dehydrogenase, decarboxylating [Metarhizium robertsii ARSEF 23]|uniref:phosphogluconate dehydrogenase (NADP(+)-dependent, decarboxylating) n=1 Tax=Metarhizium robertsii (strain ARSEF 23 / ATCC MYA-3075) TaxID=655844 RepID=E9ET20_METRA|nr:6-phosphogluconate dehydrogenase, decarboxylating [Metarhizium robertsii ARSEF 23]EFZ01991.2 6-phosphogluconate dehydrogenase, decarboxylating [Metarhizium robertsii ARSEF 23]